MGQYHLVVNLDRKQYLKPTSLGDGLKLLEFGDGGPTLAALAFLLAKDNGRGLGDLHGAMPDTPQKMKFPTQYLQSESRRRDRGQLGRARGPHH